MVSWFDLPLVILVGTSNLTLIMWLLLYALRKTPKEKKEMKKFPKISILIPVKNEEKNIGKTIEHVLNADYQKNKREIIVINDGSTDRTGEIIKKFPVKIITHKKSVGKAASLNEALKRATGEYVFTIDSDTSIPAEGLKKLILEFDERTAAVSGLLLIHNDRGILTKFQVVEYLQAMFLRIIQDKWNAVPTTIGTFCAFKRKLLKKVGNFPADTFSEDADVSLMLRKRGYKSKISICLAKTVAPQSISALLKQRTRWVRGKLQLLRKHKDIIFNFKYGMLGWLTYPYEYFGIGFALIALPFAIVQGGIIAFFALQIMLFFFNLFVAPISTSTLVKGVLMTINTLNPLNYGALGLTSVFFIFLSFIFLFLGAKELGQKQKISNYILFLAAYPYMLLLFLTNFIAIVKEIAAQTKEKSKTRTWRGFTKLF